MWPFTQPSEREQWRTDIALARPRHAVGLEALDDRAFDLYARALPRGVPLPRWGADRPPFNAWMPPSQLTAMRWEPGQIMLGKLAGSPIGHIDDRPMVTVAGARAGKTSTILEPNLYLYPGSMLVLDPKAELAKSTALARVIQGHDVYVLDPFGQTGLPSASFNALAELDPDSDLIIDDVANITQALIVDDGDSRSR